MSGVRGVLRPGPFRWFFLGRAVATLGDQVSPVTLAFAVLSLSRGPGALGLVLAAQVVPQALFVLLGGVVADRWDRRRLMLVTDVVRLAVQGTAAGLLLAHTASVTDLVVLQVVHGVGSAFFVPATLGFVGELVAPDQLQAANSLTSLSFSVASIAGPAAGGLLVALGSPGTALAVDAGTFAVSALALTRVRVTPGAHPPGQSVLRDLADGWRQFTAATWVWVLVCSMGLYQGTVLAGYEVLGPVVAQRHLGGAGAWAAVLTGRGVGSVLAGALALRLHPRRPMLTACLLLLTDVPLLLLLAAARPNDLTTWRTQPRAPVHGQRRPAERAVTRAGHKRSRPRSRPAPSGGVGRCRRGFTGYRGTGPAAGHRRYRHRCATPSRWPSKVAIEHGNLELRVTPPARCRLRARICRR